MLFQDDIGCFKVMVEESSPQEPKKEGIDWSNNPPPFIDYPAIASQQTSHNSVMEITVQPPRSDTPIPTSMCGPDVPSSCHNQPTTDCNNSSEYEDFPSSATVCNQRARFLRTAQALRDSGLIGVTVQLAKLLKENEGAQEQLQEIKQQTRDFLIDVLNNPENVDLRPFFEAKGYVPPKT